MTARKSRERRRLEIACYLFLLIISVILFGLAKYVLVENSIERLVIISLVTEFLGVVAIIAIFSFFLIDRDESLSRRISDLETGMATQKSLELTTDAEGDMFDLGTKLSSAKSVDFVGYSMAGAFSRYRQQVVDALSRGLELRAIVLDPDSTAGTLMKETVGDPSLVSEPHERTVRYLAEIAQTAAEGSDQGGNVQVRKINWVPSVYMIIVKFDETKVEILLGVNALTMVKGPKRRLFLEVDSAVDPEAASALMEQYESIWQKGTTIYLGVQNGAD
ncbi:MAG: hypothetical protein AAF495_02860 [Pseudomonadota bacterium]